MMAGLHGLRITWLVGLCTLALDQASKAIAVNALAPSGQVTLIPGLFDLTFVTNTGGVFGMLRDLDGPLRGLLFSVVPLAAIALMIWYGLTLPPGRRWPRVALGLILGGAAGNLVDRLRLGHVIDFLDAYVGSHHWPAFNLADSGICIGVAMLLLESFLLRSRTDEPDPPAPASAA